METMMVRSFLVAFLAGLLAMAPTNVYRVCAWNVGTLKLDPWRIRTSAAVQKVAQTLRAWFASLWTRRVLVGACAAVLLALLAAQLSVGHVGVLHAAAVPALATLKAKRSQLLREADTLRAQDGSFADDAARTAFDAKMTEIDALDEQIRSIEPTADPVDAKAIREAAIAEERTRTKNIRDAVRIAKLPDALANELVERGVSLDEARAAIFNEWQKESDKHRTDGGLAVGEDAHDKWLRGATNAILHRAGMIQMVRAGQKVLAERGLAPAADDSALDPGEFRGLSLLDMARMTLERAGRVTRGLDKMRLVGEALTLRGGITQSTSDFAILLENVMNKVLQVAYVTVQDTWRQFCAESTVADFRANNRYRMGAFGSLDPLTQNGEFLNKKISDAEKATITASTKGNIINVSRQMIVNDDLNAFSRIPAMLGRAAALSVEVDVYALLAQNSGDGPTMSDGHPLFDNTNHGNKPTGAALSAAALDADRVAMGSQKDPWGNEYLDLRPAVLVVPLSLEGQAKVINTSQYDPDNIASGSKAVMKPNIVNGLFRNIVGTPRITGTRRYMFADPGIAPVLEVAFLEGQTTPVVESQDGWRQDGAEMKVRLDYGVAGVDYRGAVTNAGV